VQNGKARIKSFVARSTQVGFVFSIRAILRVQFQLLISVSRAIALLMYWNLSKYEAVNVVAGGE
jgi:hypothetical protein